MELEKDIESLENCPVYKTIELFQGKWQMWVLYELFKNHLMRFGDLKKAIPNISNTMLASTLKDLEEKRLVLRTQFNEIPPRVEYSLTESARGLEGVFLAMAEWGSRYL